MRIHHIIQFKATQLLMLKVVFSNQSQKYHDVFDLRLELQKLI